MQTGGRSAKGECLSSAFTDFSRSKFIEEVNNPTLTDSNDRLDQSTPMFTLSPFTVSKSAASCSSPIFVEFSIPLWEECTSTQTTCPHCISSTVAIRRKTSHQHFVLRKDKPKEMKEWMIFMNKPLLICTFSMFSRLSIQSQGSR